MSDYPDHLNPFKRSGLRESFRSLKSAIGVRFRKRDARSRDNGLGTDTNSPGSRLRHEGTANGKPMPRSVTMIGAASTEMLPRSRFNERVARAQTMEFRTGSNPFDDEDKQEVNGDDERKVGEVQVNGNIDLKNGTDTARRRRRKKRAPLPPGARQMLTVPGEHNNSQWSIDSCTSYETDYSTTANTHSENEDGHSDNAERLKDIQEITKEIQTYCDNDNGVPSENISSIDDKKETSLGSTVNQDRQCTDDKTETDNTPPTAVDETLQETTALQNDDNKIVDNKIEGTVDAKETITIVEEQEQSTQNNDDAASDHSDQQSRQDAVLSNDQEVEEEEIKQSIEEINNNDQAVDAKPSCNGSVTVNLPEVDTVETVETTNCDKQEIVESSHVESQSTTSYVDNMQNVDQNSESIAYVDRKSIYIAGSMDNLDVQQNTETTLYITGSCDQLDASEHPKPKIRKNKLSKEIMLGSTGDGLNSTSEKK